MPHTITHHILISSRKSKFKWCYKAYLFIQTLFLSFSRQGIGTTVEMGGRGKWATCSHFSIPLLPTLNWDQHQDFECLPCRSIASLWWRNKNNRSLIPKEMAPCNGLVLSSVLTGRKGRGDPCSSPAWSGHPLLRRPMHSKEFWFHPVSISVPCSQDSITGDGQVCLGFFNLFCLCFLIW